MRVFVGSSVKLGVAINVSEALMFSVKVSVADAESVVESVVE